MHSPSSDTNHIEVLRKVIHWAESRCPCKEETPDPCTLCGATVAEGTCKAVESIFPRDLLRDLRDVLSARASAGEGGEWVLVPREPTPEMGMAAGKAVHPATYWQTAYRAMIAAAPQPAQAGASGELAARFQKAADAANERANEHVGLNREWYLGRKDAFEDAITMLASPATVQGEEAKHPRCDTCNDLIVAGYCRDCAHTMADAADPSRPAAAQGGEHQKALRRAEEAGYSKGLRQSVAAWSDGVKACIAWVEKRRHDFESEYGSVDPSTGAMEFRSVAKEEYDCELGEIEEGLRSLLAAAPQPQYPAKFDRNGSETTDAADMLTPPAHGDGEGDWYTDEDTGSHHVDWDSNSSRQLSVILKKGGKVAWAAYIDGERLNGPDAMAPEFLDALQKLTTRPTPEARDAAYARRYRWLREQDWFDGQLCVLRNPKKVLTSGNGLGADCPSRDRLDEAIDAALALPAQGEGVMAMTDAEQIRHLSEHVERLKREVLEYVRAEKVLIAAGYITEEKAREAHEIVRDLP